jgi:hypothetical protein
MGFIDSLTQSRMYGRLVATERGTRTLRNNLARGGNLTSDIETTCGIKMESRVFKKLWYPV